MKTLPALPAVPTPAAPAPALARPGQFVDPAKLAKSAHDFEAMAIGQMLQPMFNTVDSSKGLFGGGSGEEAWKPMMVQVKRAAQSSAGSHPLPPRMAMLTPMNAPAEVTTSARW